MKCPIRTSKSFLISCLCSTIILLTSSAFAQQCDNENAATVHDVVAQVATACCVNKMGTRAQRKCINRNKNNRLKRAGRSGLPSEFMELLNAELNAMRDSECTDTNLNSV